MIPPDDGADRHDIRLTRLIRAPRPRVYEALTTASIARKWWTSPPWKFTDLTLEARPGGRFEFAIENSEDGTAYVTRGQYREAVPPDRLVWTNTDGGGTVVEVTIGETPGGTELKVRQGTFPDAATRDVHAQGWSECLDQLAALLEG